MTAQTVTDLHIAHRAVTAVRRLATAAGNLPNATDRLDALDAIGFLIAMSDVSDNVKTHMRDDAEVYYANANLARVSGTRS